MKKVLFATTAAAALSISGAAFAAGHDSGNFGFSGTTKLGYNDNKNGGIFMDTDIDIVASKDMGDYEVGAKLELDGTWEEVAGESTSVAFDSAYIKSSIGTLTFSESSDGTNASDAYYVDRDGMELDVLNLDGLASLRWNGDAGQVMYAIDTGDLNNGVDDDFGLGLGLGIASGAGDIDLGFGYDNNVSGDTTLSGSTFGVSADFDLGMFAVGLSYADGNKYTAADATTGTPASIAAVSSMGIDIGFEVTPELELGVYYADNTGDNEYGVTLDYSNGPISIAFDYDTGDGATTDNYEIDVSYDTGAGVVLYAGYDDQEANTASAGTTGAFYAGAEIDIADGISATVSYAEADEIGGPEFKDGTSAFVTIKY